MDRPPPRERAVQGFTKGATAAAAGAIVGAGAVIATQVLVDVRGFSLPWRARDPLAVEDQRAGGVAASAVIGLLLLSLG